MGFFEIFAGALAGFFAIIPSYGLAIILLTIVVRVILLPLSIKQTRSMREMQRIQPEVKKLQAKHKGNRQKLNEEMMALYKEHGVNPLGGCLPIVMQIPVFIALYRVISTPLAYMGYRLAEGDNWVLRADSGVPDAISNSALATGLQTMFREINNFLGIHLDCSASASIDQAADACGSGLVNAIPYLALVGLMGLTTFYQQKQMQSTVPDTPQAKQMQTFTRIMPIMFVVLGFGFPAGLTLYWATTNIWMIGQQRIMLRAAPPITPTGRMGGDGKPPSGKPGATKAVKAKGTGGSGGSGDGARGAAAKPHPSKKKRR